MPVRDEGFGVAKQRLVELREQVQINSQLTQGEPEDENADIYDLDEPVVEVIEE